MTGDVFSHAWMSGLFGDPEIGQIWSADTQLGHLLAFEAAWSRWGHLAGLWSQTDGAHSADAILNARIAPEDLRDGTARDGVCVPELVRLLKAQVGTAAVHRGTTSQDAMDTATVLSLVATLDVVSRRLQTIIGALIRLEAEFGGAGMMGRTRMQAALPITVGDRIRTWRAPLERHLERIKVLRPRVATVQIGGAAGDRAALGDGADAMCQAIAHDLGLAPTQHSWHATRDGFAETASLFSMISGSLGKFGQDVALMAQQGINEITVAGGGGSSAMPHKQNPILAELLVTLARYNAVQVSGMHHSLVHEQERSGTAWAFEWMILPQMALATGRGLTAAQQLVDQIVDIGQT